MENIYKDSRLQFGPRLHRSVLRELDHIEFPLVRHLWHVNSVTLNRKRPTLSAARQGIGYRKTSDGLRPRVNRLEGRSDVFPPLLGVKRAAVNVAHGVSHRTR